MTDTTTITLTHEGKTYTAEDGRGWHPCAGCAFYAGPAKCDLPCAHPDKDKCVQRGIIWIEQPQQEHPLDMPGFKAQKAHNGCEGCAFNECGTNCTAHGIAAKTDCHHTKVIWLRDGCCGQPNTCEQPCFHQSGRTTPGNPGSIASVPEDVEWQGDGGITEQHLDNITARCDMDRVEAARHAFEQELDRVTRNTAHGFLSEAAQTMLERGRQYDRSGGERSFEKAAKVFNAIVGLEYLSASDIALVLLAVKLVRDQGREEPHRDSLLDAVAYMSLHAEERMKEGA